jgi:hypothetical protein
MYSAGIKLYPMLDFGRIETLSILTSLEIDYLAPSNRYSQIPKTTHKVHHINNAKSKVIGSMDQTNAQKSRFDEEKISFPGKKNICLKIFFEHT